MVLLCLWRLRSRTAGAAGAGRGANVSLDCSLMIGFGCARAGARDGVKVDLFACYKFTKFYFLLSMSMTDADDSLTKARAGQP